ncbi:MAG: O-antigen ligase family protein [Candidatus Acidiferrales bacterium]
MTKTSTALLDRLALAFLVVFVAALPHSIAAAQVAAGLAALFWLAGLVTRRQWPGLGGLGLPLALFVGVTVLSAALSLEPAVSLDKLRSTALILIVLVVAGTLKNLRYVTLVVAVLLVSAAATAANTVWGVVAGRGVEVVSLPPESPLAQAGVLERDVIVLCGQNLTDSPRALSAALSVHIAPVPLKCIAYRTGAFRYEFELPADSLPGALDAVGLRTARTIRARGTFSHFTTYAEVLLQLAALALGLWLACPKRWTSRAGVALIVLGLLLGVALAATFTRASWAALLVAALAMLWHRVGWKARIATGLLALVLLLAMNQALVAWRGVGFYNPDDLSMQYRRLMWSDGVRVIAEHPLLGIGMDSVLVRWQELGVRAYASMNLHSHFHSTPIQLAVERGLLGLAAWVFFMFVYLRLLFRLIHRTREPASGPTAWPRIQAPRGAEIEALPQRSAWVRGLALGILGATIGFLASGFLHYNLGDSEVAMLFWLLMGMAAALDRHTREQITA